MPADQLENRCSPEDLKAIASKISDRFGAFSPSNLVNYGKTVIVKPGATTASGRPIRGAEVMEALDGEYSVQPLAVTYGGTPSIPSGEDADAFERAMNMELDAAEAEVDFSEGSSGESFGMWDSFSPDDPMLISLRDRRLRHRYSRISSRFGRFAMFALSSRSLRHREAAGRVFGRIKRLWERMMRRGVPVVGLMSPASLRARVYALSKGVSSTPVPAPFQSQSSSVGFPMRAPMVVQSPGMPLPLAFDQAALERSVGVNASSQLLAQTFGGVPRVSADARVETVGYLFSGMEHDYYGLVSTPFQIVLADEDEAVLSEDEDVAAAEGELGLSAPAEVEAPRPQVRSDLPDDDADLEAAEEGDIPDDISPAGGPSGGSVDLPDDDSDLEDMDVDDQGLAVSDEDLEDDADLLDDDDDMMEGEGSFAKRVPRAWWVKWTKNHRRFTDAIKGGHLERAKKEWAQLKSMFDSLPDTDKKALRSPKNNYLTLDIISLKAGKINLALTMQATGLTSEQICGTTKKTKKKGYGFDGLPDDDSDIDFALGSDEDLLDGDFGDDDDLPDDDEDLMEDDEALPSKPSGASAASPQKSPAKPKDDVAKAVDAAVDAASDAASLVSTVKTMSTPEAVAASPEHAKRLARSRAKINTFLSKLQSDAASAEARGDRTAVDALKAQILSLHSKLSTLNDAIRGASLSGSINYGALVPAEGSDPDKIVVIAIRKTPAKISVEKTEIVKYAGSRGVRSDGHLADVFGSDLVSARQIYFSGPLVASQTGSMSAERAMEVFGGYLWGVDEEAKRMAAFGAADESILSRYNKAMDRFNKAKASDDQDLAAKMLGRMKMMFSRMPSNLKAMAVDPSGLQVPGIEISKMTSPEASAAFANVEKMT